MFDGSNRSFFHSTEIIWEPNVTKHALVNPLERSSTDPLIRIATSNTPNATPLRYHLHHATPRPAQRHLSHQNYHYHQNYHGYQNYHCFQNYHCHQNYHRHQNYYHSECKVHRATGNRDLAVVNSRSARKWAYWAICIGTVSIIVYSVLYFLYIRQLAMHLED